MLRVHSQKKNPSALAFAVFLGFGLAPGVQELKGQTIDPATVHCSQVSDNFGDTSVICSGFSKVEYTDNITFYVSGTCEYQCSGIGVSTSMRLGISCANGSPVSYTFWGGSDSPPGGVAYVYINLRAYSSVDRLEASISK